MSALSNSQTVAFGALGFALALGLFGCEEPLTDAECHLLLERYTERQIDQARPSSTPGERARLVIRARELAETDPEFSRCTVALHRSQYQCAMDAADVDTMERCLF